MNIESVRENIRRRGLIGACLSYGRKLVGSEEPIDQEEEISGKENDPEKPEIQTKKQTRILLLTNRDSDNCGDQVMEACDISLLKTVMKNLDVHDTKVVIDSQAPSIITAWIKKGRERDIEVTEKAVRRADLIVFGGAPMFNYLYQDFYLRTIEIIKLAEKYKKTILFSAIGIESYSEKGKRCQALKRAINSPCVKQITTRDHLDLLTKYRDREDLKIDRVADPAVLTEPIFRKFLKRRHNKTGKKKIGIFVIRANAFVDNKISFSREAAANFWTGLAKDLEARGYVCEFVTSGHFSDEAMLDRLVRDYGVPMTHCVFNMNTPEELVRRISQYSAVISCRLHPSIISYALGIPSVGIVWNPKVRGFYQSIGQDARLIEASDLTPLLVADRVETALTEGILRDPDYLCGIYRSLFFAVRDSLFPEKEDVVPYTYEQLQENIVLFRGTSDKEIQEKLKRKFRRTYKTYNREFEKAREAEAHILELEEQLRKGLNAKGDKQ